MRPLALALLIVLLGSPSAADAASGWAWPVDGRLATAYRNGEDPYAGGQHRGIDVAAPVGAPVVAASAGTVVFAGVVGSAGRTVTVLTADGRYETSYLHLESIAVRKGDVLATGDAIGAVGTSGSGSIARPHLHLGVREAGSDHAYVDPLGLLPRGGPRRVPAPPAPVPVGAPAAPRPEPVRLPVTERVAVPAGAPRPEGVRLPLPARRDLPAPIRRAIRASVARGLTRERVELPRDLPARAEGRVTAPSNGDRPAEAPSRQESPGRGHAPGAEPARGPVGDARRPPEVASRAPSTPAPGSPLDLGWLVACVGVALLAATLVRSLRVRGQRASRTSVGTPENRARRTSASA